MKLLPQHQRDMEAREHPVERDVLCRKGLHLRKEAKGKVRHLSSPQEDCMSLVERVKREGLLQLRILGLDDSSQTANSRMPIGNVI